jgi:hypothetical protein
MAATVSENKAYDFQPALEYGLQDTRFSRPRILNGFQSAVKCWESIVPHMKAAPRVRCDYRVSENCSYFEGDFPASREQTIVIERCERNDRTPSLACPPCQRELKAQELAQAA